MTAADDLLARAKHRTRVGTGFVVYDHHGEDAQIIRDLVKEVERLHATLRSIAVPDFVPEAHEISARRMQARAKAALYGEEAAS